MLSGMRGTICAPQHGYRIRHQDERKRSAISMRILHTRKSRGRHPPRSLRTYTSSSSLLQAVIAGGGGGGTLL